MRPPWDRSTTTGPDGLVCSVDRLASEAGVSVLRTGGNAVDAAVATSAALAVTTPHMCGMGGDLFALVHLADGPPVGLDASGRAGSGADPDKLRAEGATEMPFRGDVRAAPVPGCVDGWVALHARFGRIGLDEVLAPAISLASDGFPASPLLAFAVAMLDGVAGCSELTEVVITDGGRLTRPGPARLLRAVAAGGRDAFYGGEFGERLVEVGAGEYRGDDLERPLADWVDPLGLDVWDHRVWTVPPTSQGYLGLAGASVAERVGLGRETDDDDWAHLGVEAARQAGWDRPDVLYEGADGVALLAEERLAAAAARIDHDRASTVPTLTRGGGTIHLATADGEGGAVSLIQSNASGFGCHVAVPGTGVLLHNRGIGFTLLRGHPAEYGPGRRPPHTLAPALVTGPGGALRAVLGTMGGDSQPQIVLQLLARLLRSDQAPGECVGAPRWVLRAPGGSGFDVWHRTDESQVIVEADAPHAWEEGLGRRGHRVVRAGTDPVGFGHAHVIDLGSGTPAGAADPRALVGAAIPA